MKNWINNASNKEDIVLNTRIQLARNFNELPFPNKLDYIKAREQGKLVYNTLKNTLEDEEIILYEIWENERELYEECVEKYLINKELLNDTNRGAFIVNDSETFSVMINEEEHIKINCITSGLNLEETLNNANIIDDKIEEKFDYAFDENLGYLTTSPQNVGTGLKATVTLHLPALTMNNEIGKIGKTLERVGMDIRNIYFEDSNSYGNIYEISNKLFIGVREQETIGNLKGTVLNVIAEETKSKEVLMVKQKYEIEDKVYRAYAVLQSAVLLNSKEIIELLSYIRLGVELSLLDISKSKLNQLLVMTRNSCIQNYIGRKLNLDEMNFERANIVKKLLV